MSMYTVHVRASDLDRPQAGDGAVYVVEGFSWAAFSYAPFWCIYRRCWLALVLWLAVVALVVALGRYLSVAPVAIAAAIVVLQILFGFEAAQFRRRSLARRGFQLADVVFGHNQTEAETVFVHRCSARFEPASAPGAVHNSAPLLRPRPVAASDTYGLAPLGGGS